jgi:hypothetical protein
MYEAVIYMQISHTLIMDEKIISFLIGAADVVADGRKSA